jgi:hypothetical protein
MKVRLRSPFQEVETINGCSQICGISRIVCEGNWKSLSNQHRAKFWMVLTVRRLFHFFLALPSVSSPNLWLSNLYARTSGCSSLPCPGVAERRFPLNGIWGRSVSWSGRRDSPLKVSVRLSEGDAPRALQRSYTIFPFMESNRRSLAHFLMFILTV